MKIHLVDGTYELFRAYFAQPSRLAPDGREVGAARGLMQTLLVLLRQEEVTHVAIAFDHVVESFRNELFAGYKTGEGTPEDLRAQFELAERACQALGLVVWPMTEFEADDALASAAAQLEKDPRVERVRICTPDKDLAQCVVERRVICEDGRRKKILDADGGTVRQLPLDTHDAGLHRLTWDLRYSGATVFEGMILESPSPTRGPWAPPGTYNVRVTAGDKTLTESFEVLKDPRLEHVTQEELEEQFRLATAVRDRTSEANEAVIAIRKVKEHLAKEHLEDELAQRLTAVEAELYQINNQSAKDKIAFPIKLNDRLAGLLWNIQRADGRPNRAHYEVFRELSNELDGHLAALDALLEEAKASGS